MLESKYVGLCLIGCAVSVDHNNMEYNYLKVYILIFVIGSSDHEWRAQKGKKSIWCWKLWRTFVNKEIKCSQTCTYYFNPAINQYSLMISLNSELIIKNMLYIFTNKLFTYKQWLYFNLKHHFKVTKASSYCMLQVNKSSSSKLFSLLWLV